MVFKQPREELPAENTPVNRGGSGGPQASAARPACGTAEAGPSHRGPHSELAALCTSLFEAEARGAETDGDAQVASALRDICVRLCADGAALDSIGGGACRVQPPPQRGHSGGALSPAVAALVAMEEEVEKGNYQLDLEARKAGLRSRLAGYEQVRQQLAHWGQGGEGAGSLVACCCEIAIAWTLDVGRAWDAGVALPQACRPTCCAALRCSSRPLQEIADWERLVQEAEQYSGEPGTGAEAAGEAGSPESVAAEPAEVAALRKMHVDLHRHLTMQVLPGLGREAAAPLRTMPAIAAPKG